MSFSVSIIIPAYNSGATIEQTLAGIERQTAQAAILEVLIVDSSDREESLAVVKRVEKGKVRVICAGTRVMPALGRNRGAKEAKGDLLLFIDSDAYPAPDWVEKILAACAEGSQVGGGSVELPPFQNDKPIADAQLLLSFNEFLPVGKKRQVMFVPSCNLFCRKELFESIGGFPDIRASEDVMFGINAGKKSPVWFVPDAVIFHIFRERKEDYISNQVLLGKYIFIYRSDLNPGTFYLKGRLPLLLLPGILAVKAARIFIRLFRAGPRFIKRLLRVLPLFFLGFYYWGAGFVQGVLEKQKISKIEK